MKSCVALPNLESGLTWAQSRRWSKEFVDIDLRWARQTLFFATARFFWRGVQTLQIARISMPSSPPWKSTQLWKKSRPKRFIMKKVRAFWNRSPIFFEIENYPKCSTIFIGIYMKMKQFENNAEVTVATWQKIKGGSIARVWNLGGRPENHSRVFVVV